MLYITTRNKMDSFTAHRVLHSCIAEDGGQYLPIRFPVFDAEKIDYLKTLSFSEIVAELLNQFYTVRLTGWDVEFAIGKKPLRLCDIGRKVLVGELWRNAEGSFRSTAQRLYTRLCDQIPDSPIADGWPLISIYIAFIFAVYCEISNMGISSIDVTASNKDMNTVIALWYAKKMGLPLGKIISGTNENCWTWDLVHKGEVSFNTGITTITPDLDTIPAGLERLIFGACSPEATQGYLEAYRKLSSYKLTSEMQSRLSEGLFISVVGQRRIMDLISSAHRINGYLLDPYAAVSYGALQDYRSKTGENKVTLLIAEESPVLHSALIAEATGASASEIIQR